MTPGRPEDVGKQKPSTRAAPVRIVLIDDHQMILEGLTAAAGSDPEIEIIGTASSVSEGRELLATTTPDVAVVDLQLGDGLGTELAPNASGIRMLLLTGQDPQTAVNAAIQHGCAGFVPKGGSLRELLNAIKSVAAGAAVFPADLLMQALVQGGTTNRNFGLTDRELEILRFLAKATPVEGIANELTLSETRSEITFAESFANSTPLHNSRQSSSPPGPN